MNPKQDVNLLSNSVAEFWKGVLPYKAIILSIIVILFFLLLRYIIIRVTFSNIEDSFSRQRWKRGVSYLLFMILFFTLLPIWLPSLLSVATFLGIFGAGFLIINKELIMSIIGWLYIMARRPFIIGNRIQIGNLTGDVIDIRLIDTSLMESNHSDGGMLTGRIIQIPNMRVLLEPVINSSKDFSYIWNEMTVCITMKSNWQKAAKMLEEMAVKDAQENSGDHSPDDDAADNLPHQVMRNIKPRVFVEVKDGKIVLRLRHMAQPRKTRNVSDRLWRQILEKFSKARDIELCAKE